MTPIVRRSQDDASGDCVGRTHAKGALQIVPRRQHYLQACQSRARSSCIGATTGARSITPAPLIAAQLLSAYGFDSLLSWTHRRKFVLGFGPFPDHFSINLFLWFKDDSNRAQTCRCRSSVASRARYPP